MPNNLTPRPSAPCGHFACKDDACTAYLGKGHFYCTHPATKAGRAACRRSGGPAANADQG